MTWKAVTLTGWGRTQKAEQAACRPERTRDVLAAAAERHDNGILAFGNGRSYGDAPLNHDGRALLTTRLNRLLSFDEAGGVLVCEAGVTFGELLRIFAPRGFLFPVTPGTAFVTIGGAVANDVHGKNHERDGSFGDHVLWIDLARPSGDIVRVSPDENPELFAATIGGVGLTGIILRLAFRMVRIPSQKLRVREDRIVDLDAFFAAFEDCRAKANFSVGWIDAAARGRALGRGILETAEFAAGDQTGAVPQKTRNIPRDLPEFALNPLNIRLFNQLYYHRVPRRGRDRLVTLGKFFYPLDSLLNWNRIYGKRGFHQFQCVIPDAAARDGIRRLLEEIASARAASFLAVLKTLGGEGRGYLSFPLRGYTLALDFPHRAGTLELLRRLERITLDHGGRIYLAKDSALSAEGFARMYPKLDRFNDVLKQFDPERHYQSDLMRRLAIGGTGS